MKTGIGLILAAILLTSCGKEMAGHPVTEESLPITGTWQFVSSTTINHNRNDKTNTTYYGENRGGIKIINDTHYSFLIHDLKKDEDTRPFFVAGGGRCAREGNKHIEYLDYCSSRKWEGMKVEFTPVIENDMLTLSGLEKHDAVGVNQTIIEKYVRLD